MMNIEFTPYHMRLIIRGALEYINRDGASISETLIKHGNPELNTTMEIIETALLWLQLIINDAILKQEQ